MGAMNRRNQRAFTLTELAVVICITAVIAAVAYPTVNGLRRTSRAVACMQNLRQIGGALSRYVGEHEGTFPVMVMGRTSIADKSPAIDTVLGPYVHEIRIFACPEDTRRLWETTGTSYLWNHKLSGQKVAALSVSYMKLSPIEDPSRIMVMGDKEGFHPTLRTKLNVLYADGHAGQELIFVDDNEGAK